MGGVVKDHYFEYTDGYLKYLDNINPRNRKEKFSLNNKGELFNSKNEKIGKIKVVKSRGVIQIKTTFIQEIKIINKKQIGR
jgi:hypothetical protein